MTEANAADSAAPHNPLLESLGVEPLPRLDRIRPEHVEPGIRATLAECEGQLRALEAQLERVLETSQPGARALYQTLVPALEEIVDRFEISWNTVSQLMGVKNSEALRQAHDAVQPEVVAFSTRLGQSQPIYRALEQLREAPDYADLAPEERRTAAVLLRDAELSGVGLDAPNWLPFLAHGRRRDLREQLYRAYITRASEGELDNKALIERILTLRRELAELLGYASYAEFSLAAKMAPSVGAVESLLEELRTASHGAAETDLQALIALAKRAGVPEAANFKPWDVAFWAERLREDRFAYSEEELRPYFPFPRVLEGLFGLAGQLFGVRIAAADGEAPVYHPDVRFFRVFDAAGDPLAAFYLDAYARPGEKRGGAWMAECLGRRRLAGGVLRSPVAYLVCNQTPPVGDQPSLMTFDEVTTLFHEFGHGLQHMLTRVDCGLVSGLQHIEWDAIELPSQFMENWCYDRETLRGVSSHIESGEVLPDALFEKIAAARTFRAASDMLRQLYFALTDLELHHRYQPAVSGAAGTETAFDVQRQVAERTTVLPPLPEDRFLCSFGHIFGGGYAAGYYSYKWAEVLSADAFAAFTEAGLGDAAARRQVGERFRDTVLACGGSRAPADVYRSFRGRDATPEALLRQSGLR